eukprot:Pgem_evm2s1220
MTHFLLIKEELIIYHLIIRTPRIDQTINKLTRLFDGLCMFCERGNSSINKGLCLNKGYRKIGGIYYCLYHLFGKGSENNKGNASVYQSYPYRAIDIYNASFVVDGTNNRLIGKDIFYTIAEILATYDFMTCRDREQTPVGCTKEEQQTWNQYFNTMTEEIASLQPYLAFVMKYAIMGHKKLCI